MTYSISPPRRLHAIVRIQLLQTSRPWVSASNAFARLSWPGTWSAMVEIQITTTSASAIRQATPRPVQAAPTPA